MKTLNANRSLKCFPGYDPAQVVPLIQTDTPKALTQSDTPNTNGYPNTTIT